MRRSSVIAHNERMNLRALLGWGIVIYAVLFLVWSGLVIHGLSGNFFARFIVLGALVLVTAIATRALRLNSERDVAPYAVGWVFVAAALDAVFSVPNAGWGMYADWNLWVGYVLLLIVPFVVMLISRKQHS